MPTDLHSTLYVLARLLLGGAFVVFGIRNIGNLPRLTEAMRVKGLPQPRIAMIIGVALQLIGGLLVAIGPWPVAGGIALIVFVLVAVYLFHPYWEFKGAERVPHVNAWIMNIGLSGAFLLLISTAI